MDRTQLVGRRCLGSPATQALEEQWITHRAPPEVKSSDIYWGAVPWIGLQIIMVVLVIAFPATVTGLLGKPATVDLNKIKIEVPIIDVAPLDLGPAPTNRQ